MSDDKHPVPTGGAHASDVAREEGPGGVDPIADPGLHEHQPRPTDVDEKAGRRAERQIATLFMLSSVCVVLFIVAYFVFKIGPNPTVIARYEASNVSLGLALGFALLFMGMGAIQWARKLMSDVEIVEARHPVRSSDEDREQAVAALEQGISDSAIGRRPLIRNSLIGAMATLGLPAILVLRDLGPLPGSWLSHTVWRRGMRVVNDVDGLPIKPEQIEIGQLINGEPEVLFETKPDGEPKFAGARLENAKTKSPIIMVRMKPSDITPLPARKNWGIDGILCYSKICTHVGCPISLWEQQTHHLLCPCHQSTFDLADNGKVIFGPAARPLPQLPLMLDSDGYIVAQSDFTEPVGPSFWERG